MEKKIPLIAVVGPTASGKTALGVALAKALGGEIISADSMQIYSSIPIAAATPTLDEREGIEHHLMEFLPPDAEFSVADYVNLAKEKIIEVYNRGKQPILVGGTGLYVNSLIDNITFSPEGGNEEIRSRLEKEYDRVGGEKMLSYLASFDADAARKLHPNDRRRIVRAIELFEATGTTATAFNEQSRVNPSPYETVMIGVTCRDRQKLYDRINLRVDMMMECGLLEEAERFYNLPGRGAGQAIGHKEFAPYFAGECDLDTAVETLKRETRRYAKRQHTWFLRDERINWIYIDECEDVVSRALEIIKEGQN